MITPQLIFRKQKQKAKLYNKSRVLAVREGSLHKEDPGGDIIHNPVHSLHKILPCHRAAGEDMTMVGLDARGVENL